MTAKVSVDLSRCQGYGNCVLAAPGVFDLGDDNLVVLLNAHPEGEEIEQTREAARMCPTQTITVSESEDDEQIEQNL